MSLNTAIQREQEIYKRELYDIFDQYRFNTYQWKERKHRPKASGEDFDTTFYSTVGRLNNGKRSFSISSKNTADVIKDLKNTINIRANAYILGYVDWYITKLSGDEIRTTEFYDREHHRLFFDTIYYVPIENTHMYFEKNITPSGITFRCCNTILVCVKDNTYNIFFEYREPVNGPKLRSFNEKDPVMNTIKELYMDYTF